MFMFSFIYVQWGQLFCCCIVFYLDYHVPAKLSIPL